MGLFQICRKQGKAILKAGDKLENNADVQVVEKPDKETAESYIKQGCYCWNSGMFMFKESEYLSELETFNSEMLNAS